MNQILLKYRKQLFCCFILIVIPIVLINYFYLFYTMDLNYPISYTGGDDFFLFVNAKNVLESGWVFHNDFLGAPYGANNYDYPSLLLDNVDTFILKILVLITHNVVLSVNLQFITIFPLIALICYFVLKAFKMRDWIAVSGSLVFTFTPYIFFRGMGHFALSTYEFIPISVLLLFWVYSDDKLFAFNKDFFKYKRNYYAIIFCILIANNGIAYYPFFTCFFLCVTGMMKGFDKRKLKYFIQSVSAVIFIGILMAINLIPYYINIMNEGKIELRSYAAAEVYGLKIIQLFLPMTTHGIGILNRILTVYNSSAQLINENRSSYLGAVGIIGFIILMFFAFINKIETDLGKKLKFLANLNVAAMLLGTIGGFGCVFALFISSMIRGYNRISIFMSFFAILTVCLIVEYLYEKISKKKIIKILFIAISIAFCCGSIYEAFPGGVPNYEANKVKYISDDVFVKKIEASVSKNAMIFQLPYHQYPEGGGVNKMPDYQLAVGYIHSSGLKWSYGGMKGRRSDSFNYQVTNLDVEAMIKTLSVAGFEGIYIDKSAYTDEEYTNLTTSINKVLNIEPMISDDNLLVFYDLTSYNKEYLSEYSEPELSTLKDDILYRLNFTLGEGFTAVEGEGDSQWMWLSNDAKLVVNNFSDKDKQYHLKFRIASTSGEMSDLKLYINGKGTKYTLNVDGILIDMDAKFKPGKNTIQFKTNAVQLVAPGDPRELYLRITEFDFFKNETILK
jgi:hypothetical protein